MVPIDAAAGVYSQNRMTPPVMTCQYHYAGDNNGIGHIKTSGQRFQTVIHGHQPRMLHMAHCCSNRQYTTSSSSPELVQYFGYIVSSKVSGLARTVLLRLFFWKFSVHCFFFFKIQKQVRYGFALGNWPKHNVALVKPNRVITRLRHGASSVAPLVGGRGGRFARCPRLRISMIKPSCTISLVNACATR